MDHSPLDTLQLLGDPGYKKKQPYSAPTLTTLGATPISDKPTAAPLEALTYPASSMIGPS